MQVEQIGGSMRPASLSSTSYSRAGAFDKTILCSTLEQALKRSTFRLDLIVGVVPEGVVRR